MGGAVCRLWGAGKPLEIPLVAFAVPGWVETAATHPGLGVAVSHGVGRHRCGGGESGWHLLHLLGPMSPWHHRQS